MTSIDATQIDVTQIDFTQAKTAQQRASEARAARKQALNAQCSARITQVLDPPTLSNLQMAVSLGHLSAEDQATWAATHAWIGQMQQVCRQLADQPDVDVAAAHWPAPPDGLAALTRRF